MHILLFHVNNSKNTCKLQTSNKQLLIVDNITVSSGICI